MATVYKIEIKAVSDWINYPPEYIESKLLDFLRKSEYGDDPKDTIKFEKLEIKVERKT